MNPIVKIISQGISGINGLLDGMGQRTADTIRQAFFTVTALFLIAGAIAGYFMGQKSARRSGTQLVESTNDAFRIDIKKDRRAGDFRSMLDSELINEVRESSINKVAFPSNDRLEPQRKEGIVEPDTSERKITPGPGLDLRERISETDRTEEKVISPDVKNLKKRDLDSGYSEKPGILKDEPVEGIRKAAGKEKGKSGEISRPPRGEGMKGTRQAPVLKPIERKSGIIEK